MTCADRWRRGFAPNTRRNLFVSHMPCTVCVTWVLHLLNHLSLADRGRRGFAPNTRRNQTAAAGSRGERPRRIERETTLRKMTELLPFSWWLRATKWLSTGYQFTTGKPLKNLKPTLNYYQNGSREKDTQKNVETNSAVLIITEGQFQVFQRFSSGKLVLEIVESRFAALNWV